MPKKKTSKTQAAPAEMSRPRRLMRVIMWLVIIAALIILISIATNRAATPDEKPFTDEEVRVLQQREIINATTAPVSDASRKAASEFLQ